MQTSAARVNQINVRRTALTVAQAVNQLKGQSVWPIESVAKRPKSKQFGQQSVWTSPPAFKVWPISKSKPWALAAPVFFARVSSSY